MPTKKFSVTVKGSGPLTNVIVQLADTGVPFGIGSTTWSNSGIDITYTGKMHIKYKIIAPSTTTWTLKVQEAGVSSPCYSDNGTTGTVTPNVSENETDTNC